MKLIIIVAMTKDRVIGRDGRVPWHEPEDLRHFKRTTTGHAVIMGRKTFDSIRKPLPGRRNIVVTRNPTSHIPHPKSQIPNPKSAAASLAVVHSLEEAIELCRARGEEKAFIVGGGKIYAQALPLADEMIVTEIAREGVAGDTHFPDWDRSRWSPTATTNGPTFTITSYERRR
jgi:dihydrofolate reductase